MSIALSINMPALGDTLAAIPTLNKLAKTHGGALTVFSHHPYLFKNHPSVEETLPINSSKENYKVYNVPFLKDEKINDELVSFKHAQIDIRQNHAMSLGFSLTPEEMGMDLYIEEDWDVGFKDYIVIHPTQTWPSRTWSEDKWQELIYKLNDNNIPVVAIGKDDSEKGFVNIDKPTMKLDIPYGIDITNHPDGDIARVRGLLKNARSLIVMDSGILHIGGTTDVEIIQLGSSIHPYYRAPYRKGSQDYKYTYVGGDCNLFCTSDMKHHLKEWNTIRGVPSLLGCLENKPTFECHPTPTKVFNTIVNSKPKSLPKLLIITPHLSTGGGPQYTLDYLKYYKNEYSEIKLVEFTEFSWEYVIQKNKLIELLGEENVYTLGKYGSETFDQDKEKLLPILKDYSPDIVWMNEAPEAYEYKLPPDSVMSVLYSPNRKYKIIETTHFNALDFQSKKFIPDEFMFCSPRHIKESKHIDIPKKVWQTPIENKKRPDRNSTLIELGLDPSKYHVLNVGLVSPNKNQKYIFDLAEQTQNLPIEYHFIGNHCFFNETGITQYQKELSNCKLWGERSNVDKFMSCMDLYLFPSKKELNPLTIKEALSWNMDVIANYEESYTEQYKDLDNFKLIQNINVISWIKSNMLKDTTNNVHISFYEGAKVEILGDTPIEYHVKFYNNNNGKLIHEDYVKNNMWTKPSLKYYIEWKIEIWQDDNLIETYIFDCTNKKVYIHLDSKSLGDTIAWFPYVEEFRKKHNCKVVCSTFKNHFFQSLYPEIEFIEPGASVNNIYTQFNIGWFWNKEKNPNNVLDVPLQQTASDILGLDFKEIKPKLNLKTSLSNIKGKYVTLSIQSTAQSKYWNYKGGWQQVVNFLIKKGYKVVCIDQHSSFGIQGCMNDMPKKVINKTGCNFDEASSLIKNAQFHIGISSGLSWLAWALNTHVIMISSFTKPFCEFTQNITRIYNDNKFSGYFNTHRIDANNWHWNPFLNISTLEEWHDFESITPEQVINEIKQVL